MHARLLDFINSHELINSDDTVIVAVSAGVDSMVLLHALFHLRDHWPIRLQVVHVNHGTRGFESDEDERFVANWCAERELVFHSRRIKDLPEMPSEEVLRDARYSAFSEVLEETGGKAKIATAHTLSDQVETIIMRLANGTGVRGLQGIPVKRGPFIRPLIFLKRQEIDGYARQQGISYRYDETNSCQKQLRNRVRQQIIPAFQDVFGEAFYQGIERSVAAVKELVGFVQEENNTLFSGLVSVSEQRLTFSQKRYSALPAWRRQFLVEYCIFRFDPLNFKISTGHFQAFDRFAGSSGSGARFFFNNNLRVTRDRDQLFFERAEQPDTREKELFSGGVVYMGRNKITLEEVNSEDVEFNEDNGIEYICGDRLQLPLTVRYWKSGDAFNPLGMKTRQKLSDFFVNQKLPVPEKKNIPILCNGKDIVWIGGYRLDNRYRIGKTCKTRYRLTCQKIEDRQ